MDLAIERDGRRKVWRFVTSDHGTHTYSFNSPFRAGASLLAFRAAGYTIHGKFGLWLSGVMHLGKRYLISPYCAVSEQPSGTPPEILPPMRLGKPDGIDRPRAGPYRGGKRS